MSEIDKFLDITQDPDAKRNAKRNNRYEDWNILKIKKRNKYSIYNSDRILVCKSVHEGNKYDVYMTFFDIDTWETIFVIYNTENRN